MPHDRRPGSRSRSPARALVLLALLCAACVPLRPDSQGMPPLGSDEVDSWMRKASELRGLRFLEPVRLDWIRSREIPEIVRAEVEASYDSDYVEAYRDAYAALGLLPPDIDLLETVMALQAEQLVGIYSVVRRTLYVVTNAPHEYGASTILVHEVVHALQHQHFPRTITLLQQLDSNDDLANALGAAVEGDASLVMLAVDGEPARNWTVESAERFSKAMLVDLDHPTGLMAEVPRLLRVSLVAPYAYGIIVAAQRYEDGGTAGLDALLDDPPISTLQVIYPEEQPTLDFLRLPLAWLESALPGEGCRAGHHNVAGVLSLRVLFEDFAPEIETDPFLREWQGDRFLHVRCGSEGRLVWLLHWADADAASEFAAAYRSIAPAIADRAGLREVPAVLVEGSSTLVLSPAFRPIARDLLERVESRSYRSLSEWVADGCFPDPRCVRWEPASEPALISDPGPRSSAG